MKKELENQINGSELLERYISNGGDYAQLLKTLMFSVGKDIEPLLEKAEREGKKLDIKRESQTHDEIVLDDIILV